MNVEQLAAQCEERLRRDGVPAERPRHTYFVPGRIEVLGKHTDYAGGRSLVCTVEQGIWLTAVPRRDARVLVCDAVSGERCDCLFRRDLEVVTGWANYARTVVRRIARDFRGDLCGADIAFASNLPSAAGLSSSTALVIAIFLGLSSSNALETTPEYRANIASNEDLAEYLSAMESGRSYRQFVGDAGVGTRGGSQDQAAILCARAGQLLQCSFAPVRVEGFVELPRGYVFAVGVSGVTAEKTGNAIALYNGAVDQMDRVTELWRARLGGGDLLAGALLEREPGAVEQLRAALRAADDGQGRAGALLARADQFIAETREIIPAAVTALRRGALTTFGTLVDRSHQLAVTALGNQVDETIFLARSARELGAGAASAFGAGFGGSVWALIETANAESFLEQWRTAYVARFPARAHAARFLSSRPGAPARRLAPADDYPHPPAGAVS